MSTGKDLYRRWISEAWSAGNVDVLDDLHTPGFVDHSGLMGVSPDTEGMKNFIRGLHDGFPDLAFMIEEMVEEADKVVGRWTMTGTNSGSFNGLPPSGNRVTLVGFDLLRRDGDRFSEIWHLEDNIAMMQALGIMPSA